MNISQEDRLDHELSKNNDENPAVYVGTYGKYNEGSLDGMWVDLTTFSDYDEFLEFCQEMHSDDQGDAELMFQDYMNFPEKFYGESGLNDAEGLWEWMEMDESDKEIVNAYWEQISDDPSAQDIMDKYVGEYSDGATFAEEMADETGDTDNIPDWIVIDWEQTWEGSLRFDYDECDAPNGNSYFFYQ